MLNGPQNQLNNMHTYEQFVKDEFSLSFFGRSYSFALATRQCVSCGGRAEIFNDEASTEEYYLSALCQKCQDEVFEEKEGLDEPDPF